MTGEDLLDHVARGPVEAQHDRDVGGVHAPVEQHADLARDELQLRALAGALEQAHGTAVSGAVRRASNSERSRWASASRAAGA